MSFQFSEPHWLLVLIPGLAWVLMVARASEASLTPWKRVATLGVRLVLLTTLGLALAGLQRRERIDSMNVFFLLDRSDSIPTLQQESSLGYVRESLKRKKENDRAGVLAFAADAALETTASTLLDLQRINSVVPPQRTDIAGAIRLASAAFPETGQKRMVLVSDGNENVGDAVSALLAARNLGVTLDVLPRGVERSGDVSIDKVSVPNRLKRGQAFEPRIFVESTEERSGVLKIYRNDSLLGEQPVQLKRGKNAFSFSQKLDEQGFYRYDALIEVNGDSLPQNNRGSGFTGVRGEPQVLIVSALPSADAPLAAALQQARLNVRVVDAGRFPDSLSELQSYETVILSNLAAGDIGSDRMRLLESMVRDFGIGLVCIGGDQSFTAGSYRGTALETLLPVGMDLDSKKVLPKGAVVLVMHGMEFNNGNAVARECALGVLEALGAQDEMGVLLWDGSVDWLFPLTPVGTKSSLGRKIAGMNQGDLPGFDDIMSRGYEGLKASTANLKHMIVFSDGDPGPPSDALMARIRDARITVSTVLIAGHAGPTTMIRIAEEGNGRFHDVRSPEDLPQIFLKETAVILKSAIFEGAFTPRVAAPSEIIRGIASDAYPELKGYVCTSPKSRAETPLLTDKGDPLLAHWQYGLGRSVAFTSDAQPKWAGAWLNWASYQQFWSQVVQWSLRRLENADFNSEIHPEKGEGVLSVEALDSEGQYRNFLNLQAIVVGPRGDRQTVRLEQIGAGRYQARFPTRDVGAYVLNLMELKEGKLVASQVLGTSVSFSPEFLSPSPNQALLHRLAELGGGRVLDPLQPGDNPFLLNRQSTFQPHDLWSRLLQFAVILFVLDAALRRVQFGMEEFHAGMAWLGKRLLPGRRLAAASGQGSEALSALLARKEQLRAHETAPASPDPRLFQPVHPASEGASPASPPSVDASPTPQPTEPQGNQKEPISTTDRLLDAKRRARKRM